MLDQPAGLYGYTSQVFKNKSLETLYRKNRSRIAPESIEESSRQKPCQRGWRTIVKQNALFYTLESVDEHIQRRIDEPEVVQVCYVFA